MEGNMENKHKKVVDKISITQDGRVDTKTAAKILGVKVDTLYVWHTKKKLESIGRVRIGRKNYFYYEDLLKWIEKIKTD